MSALFIGRGDFHLGTVRTDAEGNVVRRTDAKWEPNDEGGCIAICDMDPEKMEPVGEAEVFGDWDAAHYLEAVLKKLGAGRPVNIPDFRSILRTAMNDREDKNFFCDYCSKCGYSCQDCIVTEWKEEEN